MPGPPVDPEGAAIAIEDHVIEDLPASEGVYYVCQRCTACCKWEGDVCIEPEEVDEIAAFLGLDLGTFTERYTRLRANRTGLSLIDKGKSHECIMLEGEACRIQDVKPKQCRGFPNEWNFPGWQKLCHAIPVPVKPTIPGSADGPSAAY